MLRGAIQGGQGMIANTRVVPSPWESRRCAGDPALLPGKTRGSTGWRSARRSRSGSIRTIVRTVICLTDIEAYLDLYLVTGDKHYFDAAHGRLGAVSRALAAGGRKHLDHRVRERSAGQQLSPARSWANCAEAASGCSSASVSNCSIRKTSAMRPRSRSPFTMSGIANQDGGNGFRYHTIIEGEKEKATHENTCCEGQGTRLIGSLAGTYLLHRAGWHLCASFRGSTVQWRQGGQEMTLSIARSSHSTTSWREQSMPPRPPRLRFAFACLAGLSIKWACR